MTAYQEILSTVAALLVFAAGILQVVTMVWFGKQPSRSSWLIWAGLTLLTAIGMREQNALNYQMTAFVVRDAIILSFVLRFGKRGWDGWDAVALVGAMIGLVLWRTTLDPDVLILVMLTVTAIGSTPTLTKTWRYPHLESAWAWGTAAAASFAQSLAIPAWTIADAATPLTYLAIQTTALALILTRPRKLPV